MSEQTGVAPEATPAEGAEQAPAEPTDQTTRAARASERGGRKVREGLVVSDKMDKTVVVLVEDRVKHALYGKVMRRTSRLKAHDEQNRCGVGDRVQIMETRPLSATKRWRVVELLEKAK
jgi:small subunit ribosomal protein S17